MAAIRPAWGEVSWALPGIIADDLLRMNEAADDGRKCELFEGMLVREGIDSVSPAHGAMCQRIGGELGLFARVTGFRNPIVQHTLFDLSPPGSPAGVVLAPDLAILRATTPLSWTSVPQDTPLLAVEVVSTSQTLAQLATKAQTYLDAGVEEVWLIDHKTRTVEVWTAQGTATLNDTATLTSPLLPGFSVSVRFLLDG